MRGTRQVAGALAGTLVGLLLAAQVSGISPENAFDGTKFNSEDRKGDGGGTPQPSVTFTETSMGNVQSCNVVDVNMDESAFTFQTTSAGEQDNGTTGAAGICTANDTFDGTANDLELIYQFCDAATCTDTVSNGEAFAAGLAYIADSTDLSGTFFESWYAEGLQRGAAKLLENQVTQDAGYGAKGTALPKYLILQYDHVASTCAGGISSDGSTWSQFGTDITCSFGAAANYGFAATARSASLSVTYTLQNLDYDNTLDESFASGTTTGIKWHPGHYIKTQGNHCGNQDTYYDAIDTFLDTNLNASDRFEGAYVIFGWGAIETDDGVYDWTRIDDKIAKVSASGKRLIIAVEHKSYSQCFDEEWIVPANLEGHTTTTSGGIIASLWVTDDMTQYIAMTAALAARYDDNPWVEEVRFIPEFCVGGATGLGYDADDYATEIIRLDDALAGEFSNTFVTLGLNCDIGGNGATILENMYGNGHGRSGPDAHGVAGFTLFQGTGATRDYRGLIPHSTIVSAPNLGGSSDILPLSNIQTTYIDGGSMDHVEWVLTSSSSGGTKADIITHIETAGNETTSTCPTQIVAIFGGCNIPTSDTPVFNDVTTAAGPVIGGGTTHTPTNDATFTTALAAAACGDTIDLGNATYATNRTFSFSCALDNPITILGADIGGSEGDVTASGRWVVDGQNIIVRGVTFSGSATEECFGYANKWVGNWFNFTGSRGLNTSGDDLGTYEVRSTTNLQYCEVAFNDFNYAGASTPCYALKSDTSSDTSTVPIHVWVYRNYFHDNCTTGDNDYAEPGNSGRSWEHAFDADWYFESNYFANLTGSPNNVDLKFGYGTFKNNTCEGDKLTQRFGSHSIWDGNFGCLVIAAGQDPIVVYNNGTIRISAGQTLCTDTSAGSVTHDQACDALVENNVGTLNIGYVPAPSYTLDALRTIVRSHNGTINCDTESGTTGACPGTPATSSSIYAGSPAVELSTAEVGPGAICSEASAAWIAARDITCP